MPRKARSDTASKTQTNMAEAGLIGSGIIRDYLRGKDTKNRKFGKISMTKLTAALKSVEHAIGLPKAKLYVKTDALTMKDIAEMAAGFGDYGADNAQEVTQSGDKHPGNGDKVIENDGVLFVPTKPLTARQMKERAKAIAEREAN